MSLFTVTRKDDPSRTETVNVSELMATCASLSEGNRYVLEIKEVPSAVVNSTFEKTVTDDAAKARIEAQHAALASAGVTVNAKEQLFATGTRMMNEGYATQTARQAEHAAKLPAREAAAQLVAMVRAEKREDRTVSAREFADAIHANGAITVDGHAIGEQAIRGLAARIESPMLGYVLGLRDRMAVRKRAANADPSAVRTANEADRAKIAEVLRHECLNASGERFKLRLHANGKNGRPDCYAIVGEGYSPADAPDAVDQLVDQLPSDARASFAYDVASTTWELRASVWTPTAVAEQAVGEAFEGYVSFSSKDNGTAKFRGGGGILLLRCLNASTYTADDSSVARVHRGRILYAVERMMRKSLNAIDAITTAWGTNRATVLEIPEVEGKKITLEDAIPGFYMSMLRAKQSELVGVLPGRTKDHAAGLSKAFFAERRDDTRLVRSDLAQGWTRYIQDQPSDVRRDAEKAIGDWLVNARPVKCALEATE